MTPHPFFCEENAFLEVQRLAAEPARPVPLEAVFIGNPGGHFAMWNQRAARRPGQPLAWDYHVVVRAGGAIHDAECLLGAVLPAIEWLAASFPPGLELPARLRPYFRRVAADMLLREFASDRRHMRRADGRWQKPVPPWPPIRTPDGRTHTLPRFLDHETDELGPWLPLDAFAHALGP